MPEQTKASKPRKRQWMVVTSEGEKMVSHYRGPDRGKARAIVEKLLDTKAAQLVTVLNVSAIVNFGATHLEARLPKGAF